MVDEQLDRQDARRDEELVALARQGRHEAFDELVRRYQAKIYATVYHMTSNKADAEDIVQQAFIKSYRSLKRFQGKSSFYTWVYRIAVNTAINFLKKNKRRAAMSLDDMDQHVELDPDYVELSSRSSPLRETSLEELKEKLNKALLTLSEKHRTVVVLHDIQGLPHDEIAGITGCSPGTVRSRLFYARRQLQVQLQEFTR